MEGSKPQESDVRIERSLNKKEEEFVARRRKDVLQSLKKLKITCSEGEVPNIALLGSGGGERAMVGLLGSLDQLQKIGLLDCMLYLSGVSGSTWCMASLYQEPDWSTKLETLKDKIIQRLSGPGVSWGDALAKLKKYYHEKDAKLFSLTDFWAAMMVTTYVKEINEHTLSDQRDRYKDPFPIYTVIDKQCKKSKDADPWFEFTPYEAGYSLTGAFVETSNFGSKFESGRKVENQPEIKDPPEIDMLYLQALCGSALADGDEIKKAILEKLKEVLNYFNPWTKVLKSELQMGKIKLRNGEDSDSLSMDKCVQEVLVTVDLLENEDPSTTTKELSEDSDSLSMDEYNYLMKLVDMDLSALNVKDPSTTRTELREMYGSEVISVTPLMGFVDVRKMFKEAAGNVSERFSAYTSSFDLWKSVHNCMTQWTWGRKYHFLYNMKDEAVHSTHQESEMRDFEDAGLLLNSPYFSVLREERNIDLIISLDFSEGDPFMTVRDAADMCKTRNIPFPEVNIPDEDVKKPKDFYVFKGQNTPTVIHIPLFNVVNCGDKIEEWRKKYVTFQGAYSAEMIPDLVEVAGKNITNNKEKLLEQIRLAIKNTKAE